MSTDLPDLASRALGGGVVVASDEFFADADLCVFAPEETFVVDPARLHHRHPVTPYAGRRLAGVVRSTWLRGHEVTGHDPRGRLLSRGTATAGQDNLSAQRRNGCLPRQHRSQDA